MGFNAVITALGLGVSHGRRSFEAIVYGVAIVDQRVYIYKNHEVGLREGVCRILGDNTCSS